MARRKVDTNPNRPVIQRIKCAAPFDPEWHPHDLVNRMSAGELNIEIAASWDISEPTFYRWCREHEELASAYELGKTKYQAWFIKNRMNPLIDGRQTAKHAFNATAMLANNKLDYSRTPNGNQGTTVNINNLTVNNNSTVQELQESITKDLEYLSDMRVIDVKVEEIEHVTEATESNKQNKE